MSVHRCLSSMDSIVLSEGDLSGLTESVLPLIDPLLDKMAVASSKRLNLTKTGRGRELVLYRCQKHQQGTKLDCAKITNCSYSSCSYSRKNSLFHKNSLFLPSRLMARLHSLFCFGSRGKR